MSKKRERKPLDSPFGNRPEDVVNKVTRAAIGALPVIGSGLTEFLAFVVGDPAQERRDDFMHETCERLLALEADFDQLDKESLRDNEQFQATFLQATRLSTQAASEEKRKLLQNAIINSAILAIEENHRQILMQFLERITPLHAAVLQLFDNPASNERAKARVANISMGGLSLLVEAAIPSLQGNGAIGLSEWCKSKCHDEWKWTSDSTFNPAGEIILAIYRGPQNGGRSLMHFMICASSG
jgi:hypothetical protein